MKKFSSTMKANSRRNSRNKKRVRIVLVIAGIAISVGLLGPLLWRGAVAVVVEPIVFIRSWAQQSQQAVPVYIRDRTALHEEFQQLSQQIATLQAQADATAYLEVKNAAYNNVLGDTQDDRIVAGVLLTPDTSPYDTMVIDKGADDGVVVDAPVFVDAEHVVGVVSAVSARQSLVQLVTTAGFESTVYIFGPDIYTTARGQGGGVLQVGVPQGIDLQVGNVVVTPALAGGSLGTITYTDSVPSQPEQYGYVVGPVALHEVFMVTVGRTALVPQSFARAQEVIAEMRDQVAIVPVPEGVLVDVIDGVSTTATTTATSTELVDEV